MAVEPQQSQPGYSVSAIIPAYNSERTLARAIESVLSQTRLVEEIIVVDDGSTDRTAAIARDFRGVQVIQQPNGGPGRARNTGIAASTCDWIAFLDSDDAWAPDKSEVQLACIAEGVGVVHSNAFEQVTFGALWHRQAFVTPSGALVRKQTLLEVGGFEEPIMVSEDLNLWMKIALTNWRFVKSRTDLMLYQPTNQSLSMDDLKMAYGELSSVAMIGAHVQCQEEEVEKIKRAIRIENARNLIARERWDDVLSLLRDVPPGLASRWLSLVRFLRVNRLARVKFVRWLQCMDEQFSTHTCSGECLLPQPIKDRCMQSCHLPYFIEHR